MILVLAERLGEVFVLLGFGQVLFLLLHLFVLFIFLLGLVNLLNEHSLHDLNDARQRLVVRLCPRLIHHGVEDVIALLPSCLDLISLRNGLLLLLLLLFLATLLSLVVHLAWVDAHLFVESLKL